MMSNLIELVNHLKLYGDIDGENNFFIDNPAHHFYKNLSIGKDFLIRFSLYGSDLGNFVQGSESALVHFLSFFNTDLSYSKSVFNNYYKNLYDSELISFETKFENFDTTSPTNNILNLKKKIQFSNYNKLKNYKAMPVDYTTSTVYIFLHHFKSDEPYIEIRIKLPLSDVDSVYYRMIKYKDKEPIHGFSKILKSNFDEFQVKKFTSFDFDDLNNVIMKRFISQRMIAIIHSHVGYTRAEIGKDISDIKNTFELTKMVTI